MRIRPVYKKHKSAKIGLNPSPHTHTHICATHVLFHRYIHVCGMRTRVTWPVTWNEKRVPGRRLRRRVRQKLADEHVYWWKMNTPVRPHVNFIYSNKTISFFTYSEYWGFFYILFANYIHKYILPHDKLELAFIFIFAMRAYRAVMFGIKVDSHASTFLHDLFGTKNALRICGWKGLVYTLKIPIGNWFYVYFN